MILESVMLHRLINRIMLMVCLMLAAFSVKALKNQDEIVLGVKIFRNKENKYIEVQKVLDQFIYQQKKDGRIRYQLIDPYSKPEAFTHYLEIHENKEELNFLIIPYNKEKKTEGVLKAFYRAEVTAKYIDLSTMEFLSSFNFSYEKEEILTGIPEIVKNDLQGKKGWEHSGWAKALGEKYKDKLVPLVPAWRSAYASQFLEKFRVRSFFALDPYPVVRPIKTKEEKGRVRAVEVDFAPVSNWEKQAGVEYFRMRKVGERIIPEKIGLGFGSVLEREFGQFGVATGQKEVFETIRDGGDVYAVFQENPLKILPGMLEADRTNIAVVFDYSESTINGFARIVFENAYKFAVRTQGDVKVLDRSDLPNLKKLTDLFKAEEYLDSGNTPATESLVGADYLVTIRPGRGGVNFSNPTGSGVVIAKVTEVKTGVILAELSSGQTGEFSSSSSIYGSGSKLAFDDLLDQAFKWKANVRTVLESKGEKAESLLVQSGTKFRQYQNLSVRVVTTENIDGRQIEREEEIGEAAILVHLTPFLGEARIKSGAKEILKAFNEGNKLICR